jgi:hypothetical protein
MINEFVTEYIEKIAQDASARDHSDHDHEEVVVFVEEPNSSSITLSDPSEKRKVMPDIVPVEYIEGTEEISDTDELMDKHDSAAMPFRLPGSSESYADDVEEAKAIEQKKETSWENDRDASKFMSYIFLRYPAGIPKHDGKSILGCEKAIIYLNKLNKEISEALRMDHEDVLDIGKLEDIRVNILKDVTLLQDHIKKLKKKQQGKKAEDDTSEQIVKSAEVIKEAGSPRIQLIMTPFERAVSGIIINSVVSAGHPFEDVYDFMKKKYDLTDREELAIMQLIMDMGFPIFKDRGNIPASKEGEKDEKGEESKDMGGIDYIKNYLG